MTIAQQNPGNCAPSPRAGNLADPHGDYIHGPAFSPNVRAVAEPEQSTLVEFARQRFGRPMTCACGCGRTAYLMPMPPADLDGVA